MVTFILIFAFLFGCFAGLIVAINHVNNLPRDLQDPFVLFCVVMGALIAFVLTLIILSIVLQPA